LRFSILTLGLFSLVVNAAMLELTSWFAIQFSLDFRVDQFLWDAVLGSIIITFVSMILNKSRARRQVVLPRPNTAPAPFGAL